MGWIIIFYLIWFIVTFIFDVIVATYDWIEKPAAVKKVSAPVAEVIETPTLDKWFTELGLPLSHKL